MDLDLTAARRAMLAEAGYDVDPEPQPRPLPGRHRLRDPAGRCVDVVLVDASGSERSPCLEHARRWLQVTEPGVEKLLDALDLDDVVALLTAPAPPATLADFVADHGRLGPGHTSMLLVTLGRTLARLHADGLVHGPLRARDVLVVAGRPVLAVPLPHRSRGLVLPPSPQEDAYHLAALVDSVIAPSHGREVAGPPAPGLRGLAQLVVTALGDVGSRPGVGTLATRSHDLAPCQPLLAHVAPPAPDVPAGAGAQPARPAEVTRRRRDRGRLGRLARSRRATAVVVGVGVVLVTSTVLLTRPGGEAPATAVETGPGPGEGTPTGAAGNPGPAGAGAAGEAVATPDPRLGPDPGAAAAWLTVRRMETIVASTNAGPGTDPDAQDWSGVVVAGSPAHAQATALVSGLQEQDAQIDGLGVQVARSHVLRHEGTTAQVEVTYTVSGYTLGEGAGAREVAPAPEQTMVLDLERTPGGWRVAAAATGDP